MVVYKMSFYGVPKGIMYGQQERVDELNERINKRQFSDRPLAPNFAPRPITTKYTHFPIMDRRGLEETAYFRKRSAFCRIEFQSRYASCSSRWVSAKCMDTESILRNQHVAIQKGGESICVCPYVK